MPLENMFLVIWIKTRATPYGSFFWLPYERFEVLGTGSRVEEKRGHTAALRAPVALPCHYLCGALVWRPSRLRFVATAHLTIDQVNYWNEYSDTLVRYSRSRCVNRRDKCCPFLAFTSYAYVESCSVNSSAQACAKRASNRKRRLSRR